MLFAQQLLCFCDFEKKRGRGVPLLALLLLPILAAAQGTPAGTIYGYVLDPDQRPIPGVRITIEDPNTAATRTTSTNQQGFYSVPALQPAPYNLTIQANGFATIRQNGVVLEADQQARIDFSLKVGSTTETITVEGSAPLLNTSDATVSTLIGNQFVTNMPLNGRSFSTLINLTPGVVLTQTNSSEQGQFSINGQRSDANYFTVDGVSANFGTSGAASPGQGGAGQLPATDAFGGMSNLVSLDALQEFRIQTSTFAPEYGRTPGGQVSVVTKSGTNDFHGTAFEYFRNDALDANNWFADNQGLKKPELRQNDFGGVLGGPILKDKLFFFASYEGLRVRQPQVANTYEPTLATIQSAPPSTQPLLNAFPKPNGKDFGNGTAQFIGDYSDPSSLNAGSVRLDYVVTRKITIFGRYNDAPSDITQRGGTQQNYSTILLTQYGFQTVTAGSNQAVSPHVTNEFRFNYSRRRTNSLLALDNFGGAVPPPNSVLFPSFAPQSSNFAFVGDTNPYGLKFNVGRLGNNLQQQINITDALSYTVGAHQLKFGMDYRRLNSDVDLYPYQLQYGFLSLPNVIANKVPVVFVISRTPVTLIFPNWSLFAQDTWNITRSLTITYGLRWDYNGSPSSPNGTLPFTVNQVNNFKTMTLAPAGTPLWHAQKDDFAPRLAISWNARPNLVLRAGAGIFYDLGYSLIAAGAIAFPYGQQNLIVNTSFPLSNTAAAPPPFKTTPPATFLAVMDPNHLLPRTYEWNAALQQGFGNADVLTMTFVGAAGRQLMRRDFYNAPNRSVVTGEFDVFRNGADSSYNALQVQYQHRLTHGLQALVSYTWSHSIDDVSSDANFNNVPPGALAISDRGPSDYDIRNTFAGAVSYYMPGPKQGWARSLLKDWSVNTIVYARSAPPVNVVTGLNPFPGTALSGASSVQRPNVVAGVPLYLSDPTAPGGKIINKAAFTVPASGQGDLGRNALRGFNASQVDFTLQRMFKLSERFSLKTSADFFNIFNHPQFGAPINYMTSPQFGYSTQTLNSWLGSGGQSGGLNPLYQIGGPRSVQLALKLQF
ncbi:MAG TPA: TonB-dependent receptor [Terriglobales bacterium]|nr:TonB-dependent receptor [Terriglobales bacterium]